MIWKKLKSFLKSWSWLDPKLEFSSRPWVEKTWNLGKTYDWSWLDCENSGQVRVNPIFLHWGPSINNVNLFSIFFYLQPITCSHICFALKITPNYYLLMSPLPPISWCHLWIAPWITSTNSGWSTFLKLTWKSWKLPNLTWVDLKKVEVFS